MPCNKHRIQFSLSLSFGRVYMCFVYKVSYTPLSLCSIIVDRFSYTPQQFTTWYYTESNLVALAMYRLEWVFSHSGIRADRLCRLCVSVHSFVRIHYVLAQQFFLAWFFSHFSPKSFVVAHKHRAIWLWSISQINIH